MRPRYWFLKFYLIIALIFAILGLSDNILSVLDISINVYNLTLLIVGFFFFFFNILALPLFNHHKVKKIAYVLPIYHILIYITFISLGIYLATLENVQDWIWISLLAIGFVTSIFEIVFSIYLLKKLFGKKETPARENDRPFSSNR